MQGIYRIRNKIDGKYYIGSSQAIEIRLYNHLRDLEKDKHPNLYLQNAWNKFGRENFIFEVIEEVMDDIDILLIKEQKYLDKGFELGILYNIARKADCPPSRKGCKVKFSEEHKAKISKALKGLEVPEQRRIKIKTTLLRYYINHVSPRKGKKLSESTKEKQRKAKLLYFRSHDSPRKGKHASKETKYKQSIAHIGKKLSAKQKNSIRNSMLEYYRDCDRTTLGGNYPSFYNEQQEVFIPEGKNLKELCKQQNLSYDAMLDLKKGIRRINRNGWRLATEEENCKFGT